jgi:hypothetical protein
VLECVHPRAQAPALVWDDKLAASAGKWAATCSCSLSRTAGVGEALGCGYAALPDAVNGWYKQVSPGTLQGGSAAG